LLPRLRRHWAIGPRGSASITIAALATSAAWSQFCSVPGGILS
jgi:hypothetical protein